MYGFNVSPVPISPGIRFNDCLFSEPVRLDRWSPPKFTGLYAVLSCDPNWAPRSFQPVCFAEFGNNSPHPLASGGYSWLDKVPDHKNLFVAVFAMPFSTTAQRIKLRDDLISAYNPLLQQETQPGRQPTPPHRPIGFLPDTVNRT